MNVGQSEHKTNLDKGKYKNRRLEVASYCQMEWEAEAHTAL